MDLGISILSKIAPQLRLSAPKFQKNFFAYLSIFLYFWEKIRRYHFSYFEYLSWNIPKLNQNYYLLWVYFGLSVSNGQICITVLNYTVIYIYLHCVRRLLWSTTTLDTLMSIYTAKIMSPKIMDKKMKYLHKRLHRSYRVSHQYSKWRPT